MKMTEFQHFMLENNLTGRDLAKILGVSDSMITFLKQGKTTLKQQEAVVEKLKSLNYDVSMFGKSTNVTNNGGNYANVQHNEGEINIVKNNDECILHENRFNELIDLMKGLTKQLEEKDSQIEYCKQHIDRLVRMMDTYKDTIVILNNLISEAKKQIKN